MITLVFGKSESGKTHWLRENVTQAPVVAIDPLYQFRTFARTDLHTVIHSPEKISRVSLFTDRPDFYFVLKMSIASGWNLIVDEIDYFTSPHYGDELLRRTVNTLDFYVRYGRHGRTNLYAASRRPADVPQWLISNADRLLLFHLHERNGLSQIAPVVSREQLNLLPGLPPHKFVDIQLFPEG